ncbi:MAG TPA: rhomboid family intramembrane serine protease [Fibrobacteraceae bacterium]|nr:rhomboid family intramembrane serine protease [Fibrobacteraceae bacterium]
MFGLKPFGFIAKPVRVLISINAIVFGLVILGALIGLDSQALVLSVGALIPFEFTQAWRFLTYNFVHVSFMHFLFNMLMLWMFGDEVAEFMGHRKFVGLYIFSGIFAGVFSIPFYLFGSLSPYAMIIGASGALMGVFVAYYKFFPERTLLLFFVIPLKMKYAIWVLIALDIMMSQTNDSIAHFTHLGGVLAGFIFMNFFYRIPFWEKWFQPKRKKQHSQHNSSEKVLEGEVGYLDQDKQMDAILSKVNKEGVNSLTESERQYLLKAGERLRRRRGL